MYCRKMGGPILTWSSHYCPNPYLFCYHSNFKLSVSLLSIHYFRLPEHAGAAFKGPYRPETSGGMRPTAPGPTIAGRPLRRVSPVRTWLRQ